MAAAARQQDAVLAKERSLYVNKGTEAVPDWVLVGCATQKDYGFATEMLTLNCDSGKRRVPSQEEPDFDLQLTGFVFEYATADEADNVSAIEFEQWGSVVPQERRQYRYEGKYLGDAVRTFFAYIGSFRESGSNGEAMTYNVSFTIDETPVITAKA
jgi:hypothetical protein